MGVLKVRRSTAALAVVLAGACQKIPGVITPMPARPAHLEALTGTVAVTHAPRAAKQAVNQQELMSGEIVTTGADGQTDIVFAGDTRIHLGADAQFEVRDTLATVPAQGQSMPQVSAVVLGGQATIASPPDGRAMALQVRQGFVRLGSPEGAKVTISDQEGLMVREGAIGFKSRADASLVILRAGQSITEISRDFGGEQQAASVASTVAQADEHTEYRLGAKGAWQPAKKGEALHVGDGLRAPRDEEAMAHFGESMRGTVKDGGSFDILRTEQLADEQVVALRTAEGTCQVDILPEAKKARFEVTFGSEQQMLKIAPSEREASVAITQVHHTTYVYVRFGHVYLDDMVILPGHLATIVAGQQPDVPTPAFPEALVAMAGRHTDIAYDGRSPPVAFAFSPKPGAQDIIEMSLDPQFTTPAVVERAKLGRFVLDTVPDGTWYWRAAEQQGELVVRQDSAQASAHRVRRVVLSDTGESVTVNYQVLEPTLILTWSAVGDTGAYRLRLFEQSDDHAPRIERRVEGEAFVIDPGRLPDGDYHWEVVPLDALETPRRGPANRFTLAHQSSHEDLRVVLPARGATVRGASLWTRGQLGPGRVLKINGQTVVPNSVGLFAKRLRLTPGLNSIVYHLKEGPKRDRFVLRDVYCRP